MRLILVAIVVVLIILAGWYASTHRSAATNKAPGVKRKAAAFRKATLHNGDPLPQTCSALNKITVLSATYTPEGGSPSPTREGVDMKTAMQALFQSAGGATSAPFTLVGGGQVDIRYRCA
jgi:hypothetical protein